MPTGVYKRTEYHRRINSEGHKGKHYSPKTEFKKGHHYSIKTEFKKGSSGFVGKHNEKAKKIMSEKAKKRVGKKATNWQGGKSFEPYPIDWTETLRESIRQRDNYICQLCSKTQEEEIKTIGCRLTIHHKDYNKKNCDPINLITLCKSCNSRVNGNRNYWIDYFQKVERSNKLKEK